MIKTVSELVNEGWSRKLLYQVCHARKSPAFKTSQKGHWRIEEEELKRYVKEHLGRSIVMLIIFIASLTTVPVNAKTRDELTEHYQNCEYFFNEEQLDMLSALIYLENGSNSIYVMKLTGSVVLNRVASEDFPDSIASVIYQKGQYSTAKKVASTKAPERVRRIARDLLIYGSIAPKDVVFQAMFKQGKEVYYEENGEYFCR